MKKPKPETLGAGAGGAVGFTLGSLASKGILSAVGIKGLSAAGITSGLAIGGSMVGGIIAFGVLPAAGVATLGYGGYRAVKWWRNRP